ncbi:hypothetical protein [Ferrimonas futtsuensis]|uniref:hypothetical protein n=1 Tax=Ferrimonas futtsuensis TaxID=364764 RepID=UPI0012F9E39B|nr:hypothetical protein [Ferrimonas futtsuensis]
MSVSQRGVRPSPGLDRGALLAALEEASEVVLHAAIYDNFAGSPVEAMLRRRLADGSLKRLTILSVLPPKCWRQEFSQVLRQGMTPGQISRVYAASRQWCNDLAEAFPEQVKLVLTSALPLQPQLLVGDTLFVGHYAHSSQPSALGLWLQLDACALGLAPGSLIQWFNLGQVPAQSEPWAIALGRYVQECIAATRVSPRAGECQS